MIEALIGLIVGASQWLPFTRMGALRNGAQEQESTGAS